MSRCPKSQIMLVQSEPDGQDRQMFTLFWCDPAGVYRPERHFDGKPVGYRRAQVFHARVEDYKKQRPTRIVQKAPW